MPAIKEKRAGAGFRFSGRDLAAVCIIFAAFGYIFWRLRYGVGIVDEHFYYTMVQRVLRGDRLIADEWHVTQLTSLLELIPYQLHLLVFGGTEGLLLHIRYFAVSTQVVLSLYLWFRLRRYGLGALTFILPVCTYGPFFTFTYYNMAVTGTAVVFTELFAVPEPASRLKKVFLGVVAACAVLAEPLLAFGYFAYTLQVFVWAILKKCKKIKEHAGIFFPTLSTWFYLTLGILLPASVVLYYFLHSFGWDVGLVFRSLPNMFTDYDHNYALFTENSHFSRVLTLLLSSPFFFGFDAALPALALLVYTAVRRKKGLSPRRKRRVFLLATLLLFMAYVHLYIFCFVTKEGGYIIYFPWMSGVALPHVVYTAILILLSDRPVPQWTAFWMMSIVLSLAMDIASDAAIGAGAMICILPAVAMADEAARACRTDWRRDLLAAHPSLEGQRGPRLLRNGLKLEIAARKAQKNAAKKEAEKQNKKQNAKATSSAKQAPAAQNTEIPAEKKRLRDRALFAPASFRSLRLGALALLFVGSAVFSSFWFFENVYMRAHRPFVERSGSDPALFEPMDATIERGPLKGIRTTADVKQKHENTLEDMDTILAQTDGPLFTDALYPVTYLYTQLPVGTYSGWYVEKDDPDRVLYYWRLYPDRIPEYVYLPYFNSVSYQVLDGEKTRQKLDRLCTIFDCEVSEGKAGYILRVNGVRTLTLPAAAEN